MAGGKGGSFEQKVYIQRNVTTREGSQAATSARRRSALVHWETARRVMWMCVCVCFVCRDKIVVCFEIYSHAPVRTLHLLNVFASSCMFVFPRPRSYSAFASHVSLVVDV
jgi:hypothetical protein